ncbi:MAG: flagellar biosynthesis anti-sigma factor FlgM [Deltaproteobacteria bacterium]|nr:flagellar biosynthesis anti-sigma factor FlgM [Deltaproteobacteria bacterium]MBW2015448.1 flagellar biosynthesis anti-sigma factor FlgM [Deltaproteobacteria bacterium]MBW2129666.1 flagellar biosynthesis anti-sigma factor FlgM [Deltaproteobacteria bacterium]MBW2302816.1 flagellar biosynthesis anti-sigma factor FlgM [Deltaproteobacteria bacterium]
MKIDDGYNNRILFDSAREASARRRAEEQEPQSTGGEEKRVSGTEVDLSKTSVDFSKAAEALEKDAVARAEKVDRIKTMMEAGTYEIDSKKVADKILEDALAGFLEP